MNYSQMPVFLQMRKLKCREGGRVPEGERDSLSGTVTLGFLMSFLNSMVINWQVMTLRRNYW